VGEATDEQLRYFVDKFGALPFPHAHEVLALLRRSEEVTLEVSAGTTVQSLRDIYRRRAEMLASRPVGPTYPSTLPHDVRVVADALDAAKDQPVRIWHITRKNGQTFIIFELIEDGRLAGVVESADQRIVAPTKLHGRE
jgi:hypothetical protein